MYPQLGCKKSKLHGLPVWISFWIILLILTVKPVFSRNYSAVDLYFGWTAEGNRIIYSMKCIHPSLAAYENGIFIMQVSDGKEIAKLTSINAAAPPCDLLVAEIYHMGRYGYGYFFCSKKSFIIAQIGIFLTTCFEKAS